MSSTTTAQAHSIHDPTSAAYKKARRKFLKTTRNRDQQIEAEWTPFRAAEKKYKARFPPPDLSAVLDLALLDEEREDEISRGVWNGRCDASPYRKIELKGAAKRSGKRKAYVFENRPGAYYLPDPSSIILVLIRWIIYRIGDTPGFCIARGPEASRTMGLARSSSQAKRDQPRHALPPSKRRIME